MTKWNWVFFCMVCFVSFSSKESFALSATTAKVIQGNSPRFISEIEDNIESNKEFKYFGVFYNGNAYFSTLDLNNALGVNVASKTPESLKLSATLKQPQGEEVMDLDGDGDIILSEDSANPLTLEWYYQDVNDKEIKLTPAQKARKFSELVRSGTYPYIKISGPVTLNTRYGVPNFQTYPDSEISITKTPYRNFNVKIGGEIIKYASPNMSYAGGAYTYGDKKVFDPTTNNGYLPQDDYLNNFPSTGANGLYFYLVTDGIDNSLSTTTWDVKTSNVDDNSPSAITATVKKSIAPGIGGFKVYDKKNMVLVTLKGPDSSTKDKTIATAPAANLPVDVELTVTTKQEVKLTYKFRITKWFVNRGNFVDQPEKQQAWCNELGSYRLAEARELSNARLNSLADNNNTYYNYRRAVHEGLLSEWGALAYFSGSHFYNVTYAWSNTVSPVSDNSIYVNMNDAALGDDRQTNVNNGYNYYALCIAK